MCNALVCLVNMDPLILAYTQRGTVHKADACTLAQENFLDEHLQRDGNLTFQFNETVDYRLPLSRLTSIGIYRGYAENLYLAARNALKKNGYSFIHSLKGTEYFRTLLNQGGLPVNYIKNNDGNMGNFSRFLKGLVRELSMINYDWNGEDNSIIEQFNCISYLGKAFKNENIYDVAMQIAHAIIMDDNTLLPYDDTDASLAELTKSLKKEYTRARSCLLYTSPSPRD